MTGNGSHVLMSNRVYLYAEKAPWVPSGKSIQGALEYDPATDLVRCHECGEWFKSVGRHAYLSHGQSAREYKIKHGLNQSSSLIAEDTRVRLMEAAKPSPEFLDNAGRVAPLKHVKQKFIRRMEIRNRKGACPAQILARIQRLADIYGRTPTAAELSKGGVHRKTVLHVLNVSDMASALSLAGLTARTSGDHLSKPKGRSPYKYSKEILVELIRDFVVRNERLPQASDMRRGMFPRETMFKKYFGSWRDACIASGFGALWKGRGGDRSKNASHARSMLFPDQLRELRAASRH